MLVAATGRADETLVFAKRRGQEARLLAQTLGASIQVSVAAAQRFAEQFFEPLHPLRLPPQLIVEVDDLGDETGAQAKGKLLARRRGACRTAGDDFAFERGQASRRIRQPRVEAIVELLARHELGLGADKPLGVSRSGTRRHQDDGIRSGFGIRVLSNP
jgi:hypothetical protein